MNTSRHRAASMIFGNHNLSWHIRPKVNFGGYIDLSPKVPAKHYPSGVPLIRLGFAMLISDCWSLR